jgi:mannose-6-phosphate isomerase-like protein (cupin superfamily)
MEFKNNKFVVGKYTDQGNYKGWFAGDFFPESDPRKIHTFEILYREHHSGEIVAPHIHQQKCELMIILEGKAKFKVNNQESILEKGMYIFVQPNNIVTTEFLETSKIIAIHSPSIPTDKTLV